MVDNKKCMLSDDEQIISEVTDFLRFFCVHRGSRDDIAFDRGVIKWVRSSGHLNCHIGK